MALNYTSRLTPVVSLRSFAIVGLETHNGDKFLRMKKLSQFALLLIAASAVLAQEREIGRLIDCPTAAVLQHCELLGQAHLFTGGGMLLGGEVGILPRLTIGMFYGANNLVSNDKIDWFKYPGLSLAYHFFEQSGWCPSVSAGFTMQGIGPYYDPGPRKSERFLTKAKGFWIAASNNYEVDYLGIVGMHLGVNLNTFESTDDRDLSLFFGFNKWVWPWLEVVTEYDIATNDNSPRALGHGKGYWNAGLRCHLAEPAVLEIVVRDLLTNNKLNSTPSRELRFSYRVPL